MCFVETDLRNHFFCFCFSQQLLTNVFFILIAHLLLHITLYKWNIFIADKELLKSLVKTLFFFINSLINFILLLKTFKKLNCPFKLTYNIFCYIYNILLISFLISTFGKFYFKQGCQTNRILYKFKNLRIGQTC